MVRKGGTGWLAEVQRVAQGIRRRCLELTLRTEGGYLSQACSSADVLATLYVKLMKLGPSEGPPLPLPFPGAPGNGNRDSFTGAAYNGPKRPDLDRFFFSPVHYAMVLYSTLVETGRMSAEALGLFNQDGSSVELIGAEHSPGHEVTAGSLAQCISQAGGVALARKLKREAGHNWLFMSDGEFQEGETWEAIAALVWHQIDNLTIFVDANRQQCDGPMEAVMESGPLVAKLLSFGAAALDVDGHDPVALEAAAASPREGKPLVLVCNTDPCRGMPRLRSRGAKLHYVRFKNAAERTAWETELASLAGQMPDPDSGKRGRG